VRVTENRRIDLCQADTRRCGGEVLYHADDDEEEVADLVPGLGVE
jgi:hypothetical protein